MELSIADAALTDQSVPRAGVGGFEEFYRAQADRVYRALAVTLYARWSTVSTMDNPGGWVYRVGLNWATSRWRRRRREHPLPADLDPVAAPVDLDAVAALTALQQLNTTSRAVVVCRVLLDLSTAETAAVLDIPEGTVKSRLARALATLRDNLTEERP